MTQISENFALEEFLVSQTAARHGIDMTPSDEVRSNIERLVRDFMQPIRDALRLPIVITSGYRPKKLNKLIKGSKRSAHKDGRAADFRVLHMKTPITAEFIKTLALPYDQLILEFPESPRSWIHLGIAKVGEEPRGQVLTAYRGPDGNTIYERGLV